MAPRVIIPPDYDQAVTNSDGRELTLRPKCVGTASRDFAEALIRAALPNIIGTPGGFVYQRGLTLQRTAYDKFTAELTYSSRKSITGEYTWDYDTSGGTVHITQAKQSVKRYSASTSEDGDAAASAIPKHNGALGVDKKDIKGTEIVIPALKLNVHFRHPLGQVTLSWVKMLAAITGMVNSTKFLEWDPGEVLFLGSRGSDGSHADAACSYQFAISANADDLTIGSIANVAKKGWEYLWITYEDNVSANAAAKSPKYVYVERVYDEVDLAARLGFG